MFQGVVQLADQLAMLAAQLERVAVQGQAGLGRMLDQGMRLAAVEVQAVDPDNSCRTIGKGCQQAAEVHLHQQQLEQLVAILTGQRREPLHLANPLLDAMSQTIQ